AQPGPSKAPAEPPPAQPPPEEPKEPKKESGSSRDRRRRSRSRDRRSRHRSRSRERRRSRSRERRSREERKLFPAVLGVPREPLGSLSPEERDARTVFCMQLAARIRPRDLEDFFSAVGKVRGGGKFPKIREKYGKSISFIFWWILPVFFFTCAHLCSPVHTCPPPQAEKNRLAAMAAPLQKGSGGPLRLYVGSLHCNITKDMLRGIFEPFGKIDNIVLMRDPDTGQSKGYGFITFSEAECARRALTQLNGFELAGRPMRLGQVSERPDGGSDVTFPEGPAPNAPGAGLGTAAGRLQLMAKLAEGSGLQLPAPAQAALQQLNG
ncbi:PREDICTED: probable RNA-binding protein 23, partial [Sturnus vulgaris]|uniref:probable RNA-binding protein 23 n=1 Tax=Sturnus vulgaris TaxID=9172 RepID=UPI00071A766B